MVQDIGSFVKSCITFQCVNKKLHRMPAKLHPITHQLDQIIDYLMKMIVRLFEKNGLPFYLVYTNELAIHVPHVQQQQGTRDCRLFAIAFPLHAALGQDVLSLEFDQSVMSNHR